MACIDTVSQFVETVGLERLIVAVKYDGEAAHGGANSLSIVFTMVRSNRLENITSSSGSDPQDSTTTSISAGEVGVSTKQRSMSSKMFVRRLLMAVPQKISSASIIGDAWVRLSSISSTAHD